jgi:hypothetical protein
MKKIFLAVILLNAASVSAQSYTPSVKLTAGKKYSVISTNKGSISQEAMGQTMDIPMDVALYTTLEVKGANPAGYDMASTTNRMTLVMSMMGQDVNYDSDKKEDRDGQLGEAVNGQINQTTTFKINSFGKVVEGSVVKPEAAKNIAADGNPMLSMLGLGDNGIPVSPAIGKFSSNTEIKSGASFTDTSSSDAGKAKTSMTYTLQEVKDGVARFSITGNTSLVKEMETQGMQLTVNTTSKLTGEMLIDVATGLLIKTTINTAITGNTEVAGMSIPQTGNMIVTVTVAEIK